MSSGGRPRMKSFLSQDGFVKYATAHSLRLTEAQQGLNQATMQHEACNMLGAPEVLQLTANLIRAIGAKKVLDVGVYTGASSLSAALAMPPDGRVYALDVTDEYLNIGRPFWKSAGVEDKIQVCIDPAATTLQIFIQDGQSGTFDFAFIDADKPNYFVYFELCLSLLRPGGIIAVDNTLWSGRVFDPDDTTPNTVAIRDFNDKVKDDPRVHISLLTVGDGLTLLFKK